MLGTTADSGLV